MINMQKGNYVKTLLSQDTIALLIKFSKLTGFSRSFILKTIIEVQLPKEVDLYLQRFGGDNEKTKTF